MASQTLRPHRSPSPSPSPATPTMSSSNSAKLTRQSLGPPPTSTGAAKGFGGLGVSSPTTSQPRHVSTGGAIHNNGNHRDSFGSSRPSLGNTPRGAPSGARPSSEFLPGFRDTKTPEGKLTTTPSRCELTIQRNKSTNGSSTWPAGNKLLKRWRLRRPIRTLPKN